MPLQQLLHRIHRLPVVAAGQVGLLSHEPRLGHRSVTGELAHLQHCGKDGQCSAPGPAAPPPPALLHSSLAPPVHSRSRSRSQRCSHVSIMAFLLSTSSTSFALICEGMLLGSGTDGIIPITPHP